MSIYDVIIIGSGPAGLTAAIYSARDGFNTLVIEGHQPGGQLTITTEIENFPGFPDGISGIELMERMKRQADKFGVKFSQRDVKSVSLKSKPMSIITSSEELQTKALIIATGSGPRWIGIESEKKLIGKGVSACATCDGFFFKGKDVVVVGGGDTAAEEALYLTKFAKKVTLIHRRSELRAAPIMHKRLEDDPKIDFSWNSVVKEIKDVSQDTVTGVVVKDVNTGEEKTIECEGVFVAIGHLPNTEIFKGQLDMNDNGYIIVQNSKTNIDGVFSAGDCCDTKYWQAITAAGSGCIAARELREFLQNYKS